MPNVQPVMKIQNLTWLGIVFATALTSSLSSTAFDETLAPRNDAEVAQRVEQLRQKYAPYLRSLPEPLTIRSRTPIDSTWVSKYEVEDTEDPVRPPAPQWFGKKYDDSQWEATTVPEWRYRRASSRKPVSCILWYRTDFAASLPKKEERVFLVFAGVDWEAEVWLNGKRLGSHSVYYEPFRFDVTDHLKKNNTLAVRLIDGPVYGEPAAYWSLFPVVKAEDTRYVRDKAKSIGGYQVGDLHIGSGYGIHREVYLETTGTACVTDIYARGDVANEQASVKIHFDAAEADELTLRTEIIPENFEGQSYETTISHQASGGEGSVTLAVPMPAAQTWSPNAPNLYRCRVTIQREGQAIDAKDVLFGYRSFGMVSMDNPIKGLQAGTFLLNGEPIYLRGTNVQGMNALWYWGENDKMMDLMLMLKAANFNAVRSCQHVQYPEVRELQDRLGIMSQQDQGSRYPKLGEQVWPELVKAAGALARVCYNNPGVVLVSHANETAFSTPAEWIEATLREDPDRIIKPVCGKPHGGSVMPPTRRSLYELPDEMWANVIEDFHPYWGWYGFIGQLQEVAFVFPPDRLVTAGEYGAEALDSYETMSTRYPSHWEPTPPRDADTLWGHVQVKKADKKQIAGFRGRAPVNLGEYIEASQIYQADVLSQTTKSCRLSPRRIAGYFQFHYVDVIAANWPKSIVSHDLSTKKGYFAMAQINQPLVPIPKITTQGEAMELWIANDLNQSFSGHQLRWAVRAGEELLTEGEKSVEIPAIKAIQVNTVSLTAVAAETDLITVSTSLYDAAGTEVSRYSQEFYLTAWRNK